MAALSCGLSPLKYSYQYAMAGLAMVREREREETATLLKSAIHGAMVHRLTHARKVPQGSVS